MSLLRALMWVLAAALVAVAAFLWPDLPARIPTHFGATGQPDAWGDKSPPLWFGLPLIGVALAALMDGAAQTVRHRPESPLVNLPAKKAILAAPPALRDRALTWSATGVYLAGVCVVLTVALVQAGIWQTSHGHNGTLGVNIGVGLGLAGPLAAVFWTGARAKAIVEPSSDNARQAP